MHKDSLERAISHCEKVASSYKEACELDFRTTDTVRLPPLSILVKKYRNGGGGVGDGGGGGGVQGQEETASAKKQKQSAKEWYGKVTSSVELLKEAARILHREQTLSQRRIVAHTNVLKNTQKRLRVARDQLESTRRTIFLDVVNEIRQRSNTVSTVPSLIHSRRASSTSLHAVFRDGLALTTSQTAHSGQAASAAASVPSSGIVTPVHGTSEQLQGGSVRDALLQVLNEENADALPEYIPRTKHYSDIPDDL